MKTSGLCVLLSLLSLTTTALATSRLANISVRAGAGTGGDTLIVGFSVNGSGTKPILVRGIGPALKNWGVTGVVEDPILRLYKATEQIKQNDDWGNDASLRTAFSATGAFSLTEDAKDAAMVSSLNAGVYSVHIDASRGAGVGLIECYDMDAASTAMNIGNMSARSFSGQGDKVLTVGFTISGDTGKRVLIRGIGPTLTSYGVTDVLADPRVTVFNSSGDEVASNDNWGGSTTMAATFVSVGAFKLEAGSRDAAVLVTLVPGTYTAQVKGVGGTTGNALVEVYEVANEYTDSTVLQPVNNPMPPAPSYVAKKYDVLPKVIYQAMPVYPFELRRADITGEATILFVVGENGSVAEAMCTKATDIRFAKSAIDAVMKWRFVAAQYQGTPVAVRMQVPIVFSISE